MLKSIHMRNITAIMLAVSLSACQIKQDGAISGIVDDVKSEIEPSSMSCKQEERWKIATANIGSYAFAGVENRKGSNVDNETNCQLVIPGSCPSQVYEIGTEIDSKKIIRVTGSSNSSQCAEEGSYECDFQIVKKLDYDNHTPIYSIQYTNCEAKSRQLVKPIRYIHFIKLRLN